MQASDISVSKNPDDNASLKSVKNSDFLPLEHCGLDPLFHVFNQMYIKDILNMDEYPTLPGAFAHKNHPIFKVDILGVVVKVDNKSKLYHYGVDDGTGVILCCVWKVNYNCPTTDISELNHHLPSSLANKVQQIKDSMDMEFKLGDLIHVRGKLTTFQKIRQITANFAVCIDDSSSEISRMVELPRLYKNIYNKPFQVPFQLEKEGKQFDDETIKKNIIESLVTILKLHLQEYRKKLFDAQKILQDESLQSAILEVLSKDQRFSDPQRSLDLALEAMEKTGEICRHQDKKNTYELLFLPDSEMSAVILNLLQKEKQDNTYSQNGCHIMKVFHQVKKTHRYAAVSMASVRYCLDVLETNSDIIRTTDSHYIVI